MADLRLLVTPQEVRTKAGEIETQKNMMEAYMSDMQGKVNGLEEYWNSKSGQNYIQKYQNVQKNIQASLNALIKHCNNLTQTASEYETVEDQQNAMVDSLSTDTIFS